MSKVAFICPVYDTRNHFDYAVDLYKSKMDKGIMDDFYFVFSNEEQQIKLFHRIKTELGERVHKHPIKPLGCERDAFKNGW